VSPQGVVVAAAAESVAAAQAVLAPPPPPPLAARSAAAAVDGAAADDAVDAWTLAERDRMAAWSAEGWAGRPTLSNFLWTFACLNAVVDKWGVDLSAEHAAELLPPASPVPSLHEPEDPVDSPQ
jgi:hypothetical protein